MIKRGCSTCLFIFCFFNLIVLTYTTVKLIPNENNVQLLATLDSLQTLRFLVIFLKNADHADSKEPGVLKFHPHLPCLYTLSLFAISLPSPSVSCAFCSPVLIFLHLSSCFPGFIWLQLEDTQTVSISSWDTVLMSLRLMPLVSLGWMKAEPWSSISIL